MWKLSVRFPSHTTLHAQSTFTLCISFLISQVYYLTTWQHNLFVPANIRDWFHQVKNVLQFLLISVHNQIQVKLGIQAYVYTLRSVTMASGPLKIEKGTRPVLILATHCGTTQSVHSFRLTYNVTVVAGNWPIQVLWITWHARWGDSST